MISKELLSEVLGHDEVCDTVVETTSYANMELGIRYTKQVNERINLVDSINIHELAHKCKEWAFEQGYMVGSGRRLPCNQSFIDINEWYADCVNSHEYVYEKAEPEVYISRNSEPEAVFLAAQWILDNKDK